MEHRYQLRQSLEDASREISICMEQRSEKLGEDAYLDSNIDLSIESIEHIEGTRIERCLYMHI